MKILSFEVFQGQDFNSNGCVISFTLLVKEVYLTQTPIDLFVPALTQITKFLNLIYNYLRQQCVGKFNTSNDVWVLRLCTRKIQPKCY